jgi:hypothetical protein
MIALLAVIVWTVVMTSPITALESRRLWERRYSKISKQEGNSLDELIATFCP